MGRYCCVLKCPSRGTDVKRSLFKPPLKDPLLLKKWEKALKGHVAPSSFPFTVRTSICELHFEPKHLDQLFMMKMPDGSTWTERKGRPRLVAGSVPSLFVKDELDTGIIEVKAPNFKQTYIFDIEESCDDSGSQITDDEEDIREAEEKDKEGSEDEQEKCTNQESREVTEAVVTREVDASSRIDNHEFEIIFSVVEGSDHESDGGGGDTDDDKMAEECECPPDPLETKNDPKNSSEHDCPPDQLETRKDLKNSPEHEIASSSQIDVRKILGPPETDSVINDINEFSRLCRKYITSSVNRKGRPRLMDKFGLDPPSPKSAEKSVYLYPTAKMDVETLVSHIDHVKLPSENWFCTAKDGSPTFLCWNDNYSIHKKVIFDMKNLNPLLVDVEFASIQRPILPAYHILWSSWCHILWSHNFEIEHEFSKPLSGIQLGDSGVHFSEIVKPRSIIEVSNILKLVDSAQKCPGRDTSCKGSVCKGYFFPTSSNGVTMCHPCVTKLNSNSPENQPFSFQLVKDFAQDVIIDLHNWSVTVLGTSLIFIGWKKPYIPEKLYILSSDLTAQVTFGEESTFFDEICSPQSIDDVGCAIKFLDGCVKCNGVDDSHRSDRCQGFVYRKTQRVKNRTCSACADLKKKLIRAVPGDCLVKHTTAKHNLSTGSLKLATESAPNWIKEEENSIDQTLEADEEHILLPSALDAITLPSNRWTYAVVDNTVIFQYWKDNFTLLKKVLINHDLSVQISVLDRSVEVEEVDVVSSVDDVVRILNVVDRLRVCEGYDELYRKAKDCTGYIYGLDDAESKTQASPSYMCPKCAALKRVQIGFSSREKSATKSRIQILERKSDDSEPSSKKLALEITMSPPLSSPPQNPGSQRDDER